MGVIGIEYESSNFQTYKNKIEIICESFSSLSFSYAYVYIPEKVFFEIRLG